MIKVQVTILTEGEDCKLTDDDLIENVSECIGFFDEIGDVTWTIERSE